MRDGRHGHAHGTPGVLEDMGSGQTRDGGGGVVGNPCHVGVQALEEKEEGDGSNALLSHDV